MLSQTPCTSVAESNVYSRIVNCNKPINEDLLKKKKGSKVFVFLSRLNPTNWFNDLSDIKITMEEGDYIEK